MHLLYSTGFSSQKDSSAFVKITAPNFFSKKNEISQLRDLEISMKLKIPDCVTHEF